MIKISINKKQKLTKSQIYHEKRKDAIKKFNKLQIVDKDKYKTWLYLNNIKRLISDGGYVKYNLLYDFIHNGGINRIIMQRYSLIEILYLKHKKTLLNFLLYNFQEKIDYNFINGYGRTLLMTLYRKREYYLVHHLLKNVDNLNVNITNKMGEHLLFDIVRNNDYETLKLIDYQYNISYDIINKNNELALHHACRYASFKIILFLLKRTGQHLLKTKNNNNNNALHILLLEVQKYNIFPLTEFEIAPLDKKNYPNMFFKMKKYDTLKPDSELKKQVALVGYLIKIILIFLEGGVTLTSKNNFNDSLYIILFRMFNSDFIKKLDAMYDDANILHRKNTGNESILFELIKSKSLELIDFFIKKYPKILNKSMNSDKLTPLGLAISLNRTDVVELLLKNNVDINSKITPNATDYFNYACEQKYEDLNFIKFLYDSLSYKTERHVTNYYMAFLKVGSPKIKK